MARYRQWKEAVQEQTPVERQMEGIHFSKGSGLTWQGEVDLKDRNWAKRSQQHQSRITSQASEEEDWRRLWSIVSKAADIKES